MPDPTIEALFDESRTSTPPVGFAGGSTGVSENIYGEAKNSESWWAAEAQQYVWRKPWNQVLDWTDAPFAQWFVGGALNITESCLDRHVAQHPDRVAYYWEGEPGDTRTLTYADLHAEVCRLANALTDLGVQADDRIADEPMVAELREHVAKKTGKIARPASIVFTDELPKTRSGKIMRRLLRDVSEQRQLGDVTSLANDDVVRDIAERAKTMVTQEE